ARIAGSGVFPGFMCATLLWLKQNEPKTWDRLRCVVFPKDYVRLRLTGEIATEATDASGGVLIDIQRRAWSAEILHTLDIPAGILPAMRESQEVAGSVGPAASAATGLLRGTPVVAGASDQATGALGSALTAPGMVSATIGTGGQMLAFLATAQTDSRLRVHTFCHATPGTWYLLGATLAAGLAFRWLRDVVLEECGPGAYGRMTARAASSAPGAEGLLFLPCLLGERTVEDSPPARGAFFGLTPRHGRPHLIRSVMEGITFDLRRVLDTFKELGVAPGRVVASGGGARSDLWRHMMADTFGVPVVTLVSSEQSALGAAILAGLGTGVYASAAEGCAAVVRYGPTVEPEPAGVRAYRSAYERFCSLYESLRPEFVRFEDH
ncbi:MAG: xylulokinase, partial [Nitrososphaerales archaeon]